MGPNFQEMNFQAGFTPITLSEKVHIMNILDIASPSQSIQDQTGKNLAPPALPVPSEPIKIPTSLCDPIRKSRQQMAVQEISGSFHTKTLIPQPTMDPN